MQSFKTNLFLLFVYLTGEDATLTMRSLKNVVMEKGQRFTLREGRSTIGTGVITDILTDYTDEW